MAGERVAETDSPGFRGMALFSPEGVENSGRFWKAIKREFKGR